MKVKANFDYKDLQLNKIIVKDEEIEVSQERANELCNKKFNGIPFCEIVEENEKEELEEMEDEKPKIEKATKRQPRKEKAVK